MVLLGMLSCDVVYIIFWGMVVIGEEWVDGWFKVIV